MTAAAHRQGLTTFYLIVLTQTISLIGSQLSSFVIGITVYQQTGDVTPLALVSFFALLPMILASAAAGVIADRFDRRVIMVLADSGAALGTVFLLVVFATGTFQIWHVYLAAAWQALCGTFQQPAFGASVTMLVPDEHRNRANAVRQMSDPLAGILAPALAGVLFALVGVLGVLVIDLLSFGVAITAVFLARIPRPTLTKEGQAARSSMGREIASGFTFIWERRPMFLMLVCAMLVNFLLNGVMVLATPYILTRSGSDTVALGLVMSALSAGGLVGAVVMGVWGGTRPRIHTIMPAIVLCGAAVGLFGLAQNVPVLAAVGFLIPFFPPFANACLASVMQGKVPPDMQGKVIGALGTVAMLMSPLAMLLTGPLADNVFKPLTAAPAWAGFAPLFGAGVGAGMGLMITLGGIITMLVTLAFYAMPMLRGMEHTLPDYTPIAAPEAVEGVAAPQPAAGA